MPGQVFADGWENSSLPARLMLTTPCSDAPATVNVSAAGASDPAGPFWFTSLTLTRSEGTASHCPPPTLSEPAVLAVAKKHGVSAAQVALKWILQQAGPHTLTTQSHDLAYDKEDLGLWGFNLTETEIQTLDAVVLPDQ